jgi:DNA-binding NtrC family response regulator
VQAAQSLRPKILVADDDDGVRTGLIANLELEGYSVSEARDGAEAMRLLGSQAFDLVVSDVVMPAATGVEVLCAVRKQQLDTPFILISAFVSEDLVTRALNEGLFAMLYKPFAMERILEVVARALAHNVVLLIDEASSHIAGLAPALRSAGMRVELRETGASALDFAREHGVDVCVLGPTTEPLGALQMCDALRKINTRMDIIAITRRASNEQVRELTRSGVTTCLPEPFEARELLTAIARVRAATAVKK